VATTKVERTTRIFADGATQATRVDWEEGTFQLAQFTPNGSSHVVTVDGADWSAITADASPTGGFL